jgi:hypothetical protein
MDMRKYSGGQFIKADDVREGPLQMRIAAIKEGNFERPDMVSETGESMSLNASNTKILVKAYGPNSDDWIGKEIELSLGQVPFQGKLTDSVIVKPLSPPIAAAERESAIANMRTELNDEIPF